MQWLDPRLCASLVNTSFSELDSSLPSLSFIWFMIMLKLKFYFCRWPICQTEERWSVFLWLGWTARTILGQSIARDQKDEHVSDLVWQQWSQSDATFRFPGSWIIQSCHFMPEDNFYSQTKSRTLETKQQSGQEWMNWITKCSMQFSVFIDAIKIQVTTTAVDTCLKWWYDDWCLWLLFRLGKVTDWSGLLKTQHYDRPSLTTPWRRS